MGMTQTSKIEAGTEIQHRKVGKATLVKPAYDPAAAPLKEDGSGWWLVQFTTGKYKGGAERALYITEGMIIS